MFTKYIRIPNHDNLDEIDKIRERMPSNEKWICTEKIHGANMSVIVGDGIFDICSKNNILGRTEDFFNGRAVLEGYKDRFDKLYMILKHEYPEITHIQVYGELFGGSYPHKDVEKVPKVSRINKGVFYCPHIDWAGYDIKIDGRLYLNPEEALNRMAQVGIPKVPVIKIGTFEECLAHNHTFESHIYKTLGLPKIEDNVAEGFVMEPMTIRYFGRDRVMIKSKAPKFIERKSVRSKTRGPKMPTIWGVDLEVAVGVFDGFICSNRYDNVISHIGELRNPKDTFKHMTELYNDAFDDFLIDHKQKWDVLGIGEHKTFEKAGMGACSKIVNRRRYEKP